MVSLFLLAVVSIGGFVVAWQSWPPFLTYREKRLMAEYDGEIRRYLNGSDSLDVAAHRLARVIVKLLPIIAQLQDREGASSASGSMSITALEHAPDISTDDPRVQELVLNAMKLSDPPEASEPFKTEAAQMWDSIIRARGYRSVR